MFEGSGSMFLTLCAERKWGLMIVFVVDGAFYIIYASRHVSWYKYNQINGNLNMDID